MSMSLEACVPVIYNVHVVGGGEGRGEEGRGRGGGGEGDGEGEGEGEGERDMRVSSTLCTEEVILVCDFTHTHSL